MLTNQHSLHFPHCFFFLSTLNLSLFLWTDQESKPNNVSLFVLLLMECWSFGRKHKKIIIQRNVEITKTLKHTMAIMITCEQILFQQTGIFTNSSLPFPFPSIISFHPICKITLLKMFGFPWCYLIKTYLKISMLLESR